MAWPAEQHTHRVADNLVTGVKGADVKYIDPTYMIRAVPTNPNDRIYCKVRLGSPGSDDLCNVTAVSPAVAGLACTVSLQREISRDGYLVDPE